MEEDESESSKSKQVEKPKGKRDRLEIIHSILVKILDENDQGSFHDDEFFLNLEEDEIDVIKELFDDISWWVEIIGPCIVIALPLAIWFIRSRIHNNRLNRYQNQIDRIARDINVNPR
jgi:hypothetical protein